MAADSYPTYECRHGRYLEAQLTGLQVDQSNRYSVQLRRIEAGNVEQYCLVPVKPAARRCVASRTPDFVLEFSLVVLLSEVLNCLFKIEC